MSIIESIRSYLMTYPALKPGAPLYTDHLGPGYTEYAIIPLAGGRIVDRYVHGASLREYHFAFRSMESTAGELERLENSGFFETLADWLEEQTDAGNLPDLGEGKTTTAIEATGWAYLYEQGQSDTGIYQIQCRLEYEQEPL